MDTQLQTLLELCAKHGEKPFEIDDVNFFLSDDGRLWLKQVSDKPLLVTFSDHGWAIINNHKPSK
jgi:hypothetical protein